jgi:outer membrane biogenesis lipoprotein LolB
MKTLLKVMSIVVFAALTGCAVTETTQPDVQASSPQVQATDTKAVASTVKKDEAVKTRCLDCLREGL